MKHPLLLSCGIHGGFNGDFIGEECPACSDDLSRDNMEHSRGNMEYFSKVTRIEGVLMCPACGKVWPVSNNLVPEYCDECNRNDDPQAELLQECKMALIALRISCQDTHNVRVVASRLRYAIAKVEGKSK